MKDFKYSTVYTSTSTKEKVQTTNYMTWWGPYTWLLKNVTQEETSVSTLLTMSFSISFDLF